jgi:hypothetical protein
LTLIDAVMQPAEATTDQRKSFDALLLQRTPRLILAPFNAKALRKETGEGVGPAAEGQKTAAVLGR